MNRDQALQEIKGRYAEYLKPAKKRGTYICPLCHNGEGPDGDGITVKPGTTHLKCFKCGFGGDIVDLYQAEHGGDTKEALEACDWEMLDAALMLEKKHGAANQEKSSASAAYWLPTNGAYRCEYVARQIGVKDKYGLSVTSQEKRAMLAVLHGCPGQAIPER